MSAAGELAVGLVVLIGLVGSVVPILPGPVLVVAAVGVWAAFVGTPVAWSVFGVSLVVVATAGVLKYVVAGRSMTRSGVPSRTLVVAGLAGVVGFFVIPVVGLPLAFVAAVYLAELQRLGDQTRARRSTVAALKAVGLSMLIEIAAAGISAATWLVTALST